MGLIFVSQGWKKPDTNCKYFICIDCSKANFSNKLIFNHHKYKEGCNPIKYPYKMSTLVLPYHDFLPRQEKKVEFLSKEEVYCINDKKNHV